MNAYEIVREKYPDGVSSLFGFEHSANTILGGPMGRMMGASNYALASIIRAMETTTSEEYEILDEEYGLITDWWNAVYSYILYNGGFIDNVPTISTTELCAALSK